MDSPTDPHCQNQQNVLHVYINTRNRSWHLKKSTNSNKLNKCTYVSPVQSAIRAEEIKKVRKWYYYQNSLKKM